MAMCSIAAEVLADGIEHHRPFAFGDGLAHDMDALGLESIEIAELTHGERGHWFTSCGAPRRKTPSSPT